MSVNHTQDTFDEIHVKFDLGQHGSAWFFFDTAGKLIRNKCSTVAHCKSLLRASRWFSEKELDGAFDRMVEIAYEESGTVVGKLRK